MPSKTFHHLEEGQTITLELVDFGPAPGQEKVLETTEGQISEVLKTRLSVSFTMRFWGRHSNGDVKGWKPFDTVQHFSKRTGYLWGGDDPTYRISASHSKRKDP